MTEFESTFDVKHSTEHVFAWHKLPGALTRICPHWAQEVVRESDPPLEPGTRSQLKISAPGSYGLVRRPWTALHEAGPKRSSFIDEMEKGPLAHWRHTHMFRSIAGGTEVQDEVDFAVLPRGSQAVDPLLIPTLDETFKARARRLAMDLDFHEHLGSPLFTGATPRRILIGGSSGLIGTQLVALLTSGGHEVRRLVRRAPKAAHEVQWNPETGLINSREVAWADVVIHLGGRAISPRMSRAIKDEIYSSRIDSTMLLAETIKDLPEHERPWAFISASAIGYYGDKREGQVTENSGPGEGFLAQLCHDWEQVARSVESAGVRSVQMRIGIVLSTLGGALRMQLPLYLGGAGGSLGSGEHWMSWVSLDDAVRAHMVAAVDDSVRGPVNVVAPHAVPQKEFAQTLAKHLRRPTFPAIPGFAPRLLLGREGASEVVMANQHVVPEALSQLGYRFAQPTLDSCLREELGEKAD